MLPDLAEQALVSAGFRLEEAVEGRVVGEYTHLVLACGDLIVKFWRSELKQRVDAYVHRLLAQHLPVPPVRATGRIPAPVTGALTPRFHVAQGEPLSFTVYGCIAGALPAERVEAAWDPTTRRAAYAQAGRWLRVLHEVRRFEQPGPLAPFGREWQGTADDWCGYLLAQIERWDEETARHELPRGDRRLRRRVRDWLVDELPRVAVTNRFVLCHRDYSFRNLLARPDGALVAVIDFEHAIAGDPVFDWHRIAAELLCRRPDDDCWRTFLDGYGADAGDAEVEQRLRAYLALYGVTTMGYALREGDPAFYGQAVELLGWVARRLD